MSLSAAGPVTLTANDRAEIRRLAEKATQGPWAVRVSKGIVNVVSGLTHIARIWKRGDRDRAMADAAYIARLDPATVIALLDEIEQKE